MSTTHPYGSAEAQAARSLIGGTTLGDTRNELLKQILVAVANKTSGPSGVAWGAITGTLDDQTDLANALAAKLDKAGGTMTGALVNSTNGAASTPALQLTGTPFTGGSATTTKPLALVEPAGATSNNWSTSGTLLGVNAPSGFTGDLLSGQVNATNKCRITANGEIYLNDADLVSMTYASSMVRFNGNSSFSVGIGRSGNLGLALGSIAGLRWTNDIPSATADVHMTRRAASVLALTANETRTTGAALELVEQTAPSSPGSNCVRIYAEDNGSGKTRLMALFASGAAQQIAIEP